MHARKSLSALTLGASGVVFGDIGTSPLYALKEIFNGHHPIAVTPDNVLGVRSMVFWAIMVLVTLKYVLIYFGQDALPLHDGATLESPFFHLGPGWALAPLLVLATLATVIASQAVISGAFSVARQAVQRGLLSRMLIVHTSGHEQGQIYAPFTNWTLYLDMVDEVHRVRGTAIFMTSSKNSVPSALLHKLKHNPVLHDRVVLLTVQTADIPCVSELERICLHPLRQGLMRVVLCYGFMEDPDNPSVLLQCSRFGENFDMMETSFHLSRESVIPRLSRGRITRWRGKLFALMSKNATSATDFFRIPANRVVELGTQWVILALALQRNRR